MADTLTTLQVGVRFWANDSEISLVASESLAIANQAYQSMLNPDFRFLGIKLGRLWPEVTRENTSLTMVVGDEDTYTWPTTPVFKEPVWVEGLDANNNSEPYPILWAPDMLTWSAYDQQANDEPMYCRKINVSGTTKLALRPKPIRADGIRITGIIEATEFSSGSSATVFLNKATDDALAMLIAALFLVKRGDMNQAQLVARHAAELLPIQDAAPSLTGTGRIVPWGGRQTRRRGL